MDPRAGVTPSIRNFAHAIDRQRQALERIPVLDAQRVDLEETARALDEAEAAALAVAAGDDLGRFAAASRAISIPLLRADVLAEEFRIYESRAAGADAILLRASAVPQELLTRFKAALRDRGLDEEIRANKAGCLDNCENGCSVVVYPEAVWYGHVTEADVDEIVDKHLVQGEPVERLRLYKR